MPDADRALFYPVMVAAHGKVSLRWGPPCDAPQAAKKHLQAEHRAGNITLGFVVEFSGGRKTPLPNFTVPESARKVVLHYEAVWDATEPGGE